MNFTGYHVTIFSRILTSAGCLEVGLGLELVLGLYSMSGWSVVMHTYFYTTFGCRCYSPAPQNRCHGNQKITN